MLNSTLLLLVIIFLPGILVYDQFFDFYPPLYPLRRFGRGPPQNRGHGRGHGPPDFARNHGHGPKGPPPFAHGHGHGHKHYDSSSSEEEYDFHETTTKKPDHTTGPAYEPLKTTTDYSSLIDVRFGERTRRSTKTAAVTTEVLSRHNSLNHYPLWNTPDPNFKPYFFYPPQLTKCVEKKSECIPAFKCKSPPSRNSQFGFCRWVRDEPYVCCEKKEKMQSSKCEKKDTGKSQSIIGGVSLEDGTKYPWMVAIGERDKNNTVDWYCGGALISPETVITAAHCVSKRRADVIRIGDTDLTVRIGSSPTVQEITVCESLIHPLYKSPLLYNDVALLYLEEPVKDSALSRPVCLPEKSVQDNVVLLTGWGQLGFAAERSAILQEVTMKIFNNTYCDQQYSITQSSKRNFPRGILDTQMCAGDEEGGKDACQGDSGSPLVSEEDGNFVLIGIVSAGIGCGSKTFPGVYTRISAFTPWILENIR